MGDEPFGEFGLAASLPEFGTDQHQYAQQTQFTHVIFSIVERLPLSAACQMLSAARFRMI